jgi:hypothetical protein
MDCRETQALLTAFHDGELPAADRARVEEHLCGCPECGALLADLARADRAGGVPDPGPAYWDRFNARVMDRVEREADRPVATVLRPKGGWMRQQLRYLVPAAAAAALVVMVVRYGGMQPGVPTTEKREPAAVARRVPEESSRVAEAPAAPPPVLADERLATAARGERDRLPDRPLSEANERTSRDRAAAPAGIDAPSPPPVTMYRSATAGSQPVTAGNGIPSRVQGEQKKMAGAAAPAAEPQLAAKAETASGMRMPKDRPAEAPPAVSLGKTRSKEGPAPLASAPPGTASPCELAPRLAARERWWDAETAQRACLAQDRSAPTQEKGLVFLAELLDRQARFAEADAVIAEVDRQYPQSRPLDLYRQQRPMVQKQPAAAPATR